MSRLTLSRASEKQLGMAYRIMREFHDSVSHFPGEMSSPSLEHFIRYWHPSSEKIIFLLCDGVDIAGIALLQEITEPSSMELGAIYVKPDHRKGFNAYRLYFACAAIARQRNLPLNSEISKLNHHSIALASAVAKRYVRIFPDSEFSLSSTDLHKVTVSLSHK